MAGYSQQDLARLKLAQAPDKTFIGRIAMGFDFLVYHFSRVRLSLAKKTLEKHAAHRHRRDEQQNKQARKTPTAPAGAAVLDACVKRWQRWCTAGLAGLLYDFDFAAATLRPSQRGTRGC